MNNNLELISKEQIMEILKGYKTFRIHSYDQKWGPTDDMESFYIFLPEWYEILKKYGNKKRKELLQNKYIEYQKTFLSVEEPKENKWCFYNCYNIFEYIEGLGYVYKLWDGNDDHGTSEYLICGDDLDEALVKIIYNEYNYFNFNKYPAGRHYKPNFVFKDKVLEHFRNSLKDLGLSEEEIDVGLKVINLVPQWLKLYDFELPQSILNYHNKLLNFYINKVNGNDYNLELGLSEEKEEFLYFISNPRKKSKLKTLQNN